MINKWIFLYALSVRRSTPSKRTHNVRTRHYQRGRGVIPLGKYSNTQSRIFFFFFFLRLLIDHSFRKRFMCETQHARSEMEFRYRQDLLCSEAHRNSKYPRTVINGVAASDDKTARLQGETIMYDICARTKNGWKQNMYLDCNCT